MSLKEEMKKQFQDIDVSKTSEQLTEDIKNQMKIGKTEIFYEKRLISKALLNEFSKEGFSVEAYEDEHSKSAGLELIRISW